MVDMILLAIGPSTRQPSNGIFSEARKGRDLNERHLSRFGFSSIYFSFVNEEDNGA
jgi:hypothetical protein